MSAQELKIHKGHFLLRSKDGAETIKLEDITHLTGDVDVYEVKMKLKRFNILNYIQFQKLQATVEHLLAHADSDKDEKLSLEEVLENYDVILESQVSDHGDLHHDEL